MISMMHKVERLIPEGIEVDHHFVVCEDEVNIHYVRKGEGQPVVLLHGWPGFWYDWRHVVEPLSEFSDVIAPDFRGYGDSDKPDLVPTEGYTPDHLAKDVIFLLEHLNIKNAVVVAHDIGATIAQLLAKKYPDYVQKLVLLNPPYNGIGTRRFEPSVQGQFWYQHFHNFDWSGDLISYNEDTIRLYLTHFYRMWTGNKAALSEKELDAIIKMYAKEDTMKKSIYYYKARALAKRPSTVQESPEEKIKQKTSILWGEDDPVMLADWSDRLGDYFEDFKIEKLPGIGHFVPFEAPEKVIEAIRLLIKLN
jgi:pimeloyl-ACP methyl ester carboxylesterase